MGVEVTLKIDEDILERLRAESEHRSSTLDETLNDVLRATLRERAEHPFEVRAISSGLYPDLDYSDLNRLVQEVEGPWRR